jgi:D-arabinose 1-dehydrogenase-like Zn-dependent alcohol dehydrogenase
MRGWNVNSFDLIFKDLRIRGSLYASVPDAEDMLLEIAKKPVKIVKKIYDFEHVNQAVEDSKKGGKIVVEFAKEE